MLRYPVTLERDTNGTMRVEFPDVPEANTFGEDADEALIEAVDALESALSMYIEDRRDIPKPSPVRARRKAVILPALTEAKLALDSTMRANRVGKAELARRLNCPGGPLALSSRSAPPATMASSWTNLPPRSCSRRRPPQSCSCPR